MRGRDGPAIVAPVSRMAHLVTIIALRIGPSRDSLGSKCTINANNSMPRRSELEVWWTLSSGEAHRGSWAHLGIWAMSLAGMAGLWDLVAIVNNALAAREGT